MPAIIRQGPPATLGDMKHKMRKLVFSFMLVCAAVSLMAQNQRVGTGVSVHQYDSLKAAGALNSGLYFIDQQQNAMPLSAIVQPPSPTPQAQAACECVIQLDATFQVVPFQFGQAPDYRNDDFSSTAINLPFNFCMYGQTQSTVYINNNGNVSFGAPYGTFSGVAFPSANYTMIAPFWADVDTRALASGLVYYKLTPTALIVRWQTVGYYSQHVDKLNDFQLIITDGNDPILPIGTNCAFCYGDMQWTTGDASGGTNGFGGTAATVGCNLGDGVNFIQIGRFDQPGTVYNGPFANSQVSWLDTRSFFFDVCNIGTGGNIPPLMNSAMICDTFDLCVGDTLQLQALFLSPENNQLTTATASTTSTGLTNVGGPPANPVNLNAYFVGLQSNLGVNTILITGTDNGNPPLSSMSQIFVNVIQGPTAAVTSTSACPGDSVLFGTNGTVTINGPIVQYHWDFGMPALTNDTANTDTTGYAYANPGTYTVFVEVTDSLGCSDTAQYQAVVYELPVVAFTGTPLTGCAPLCVDFTDQSTVTNSVPAAWSWNFGNGEYDSIQNPANVCYYDQGSYSVELVVTSAQGCTDSMTITNMLMVIPGPVAGFSFGPQPATLNDPSITFVDLSTNGTVEWFWSFGDNGTSTDPNPIWMYQDTGTFTVMQIVSGPGGACPDTATAEVVISPELLVWIPNAFTPNGNGNDDRFMPVFSDFTYVKNFNMMIFDRWGQLIYQTNDPLAGWDGRIGNGLVQVDTYVYKIHVEDLNGVASDYIGGFNLIK